MTKLYAPAPQMDRVPRSRLTERLAAGLQHPLTLISAPAGFGKTSILSEWRANPEGRSCSLTWLSLDQGDNDPARFWAYVLAALRMIPELTGLPDQLETGAPPDLLLAPIINGLAAVRSTVVLVLDDYHTIEQIDIHGAVNFLVEHMPSALRLVVLTRSDPPWPMARLRAHGLMSELRADDLRFTPEEATRFFTGATEIRLSDADIDAVEQRTEGWIAALRMVAISLDGHPDPHGFVTAFSGENRYITDYLAEEVLARQPANLRRFLLHTSILERFNASLCAAVTGYADSQSLIDQIERRGLFLVELDLSRQWFRFQILFGDLLRSYLQQTEPGIVSTLHGRAAAWFTSSGMLLEAASHSLAAGDYDQTITLIEQHGDGWWAMANPLFARLIMRFPAEVTCRSPLLCTFRAWMHCIQGETAKASALLDGIEGQQPLSTSIESVLTLMRAWIAALSGQPYKVTDSVVRAPETIPVQSGGLMRSTADMALALVLYLDGQLDAAADLLVQAARREETTGTAMAIPLAISRLARIRLIQGKVGEADIICRRYLSLIAQRGENRFYVCGNLHAVMADVLRLRGDLDGADAEAKAGLRLNQAWPVPHAKAVPIHALARILLARGAAQEALALLDEEESVTGTGLQSDLVSERESLRVEAWLAIGDLESAKGWARECGLKPQDPLSFREELRHMALAEVLMATGCPAEGTVLLHRLEEAATRSNRLGRLDVIRRLTRSRKEPVATPLSEREQEILRLIAEGRSNQEIAKQLVVAVGTVKVHIHNLFQKLEVQNRTQAVARGRELNLLP